MRHNSMSPGFETGVRPPVCKKGCSATTTWDWTLLRTLNKLLQGIARALRFRCSPWFVTYECQWVVVQVGFRSSISRIEDVRAIGASKGSQTHGTSKSVIKIQHHHGRHSNLDGKSNDETQRQARLGTSVDLLRPGLSKETNF
jgi:hypothetical protein